MKEKVILKSAHPEEYPDLVIECRVIANDKIGEYLESIPNERKFYAYKSASVKARKGNVGETINSLLRTTIDGREYILGEESTVVCEREFNGENVPDMVITNDRSTSNEEYVVKMQKFVSSYTKDEESEEARFIPVYDSRLFTKIDENVIIMTAWGSPAICLAGSYIVTYNAEENDYNTVEKGAFESTYTKEEEKSKNLVK